MIGFAQLRRMLPHRYPVMLVDRVDEIVTGERLTARKAIAGNELWFAGVGDDAEADQLRYPEVLVLESWCQAAGVLINAAAPNWGEFDGRVMLIGSVSDVRYARPVVPGDVLVHQVRILRARGDTAVLTGEALVDGETVMVVGKAITASRPAERRG